MTTAPRARIACVNVLKQSRLAIDRTLDESGHNKHVNRLVGLKHWAEPLHLPDHKMTYHVLEAIDPAEALLDYARSNHVDHIVMGARGSIDAAKIPRQRIGGRRIQRAVHRDGRPPAVFDRMKHWHIGNAKAAAPHR